MELFVFENRIYELNGGPTRTYVVAKDIKEAVRVHQEKYPKVEIRQVTRLTGGDTSLVVAQGEEESYPIPDYSEIG